MRIAMIAICYLTTFTSIAWGGGNPTFDPHWTIGDSWAVRYTAKAVSVRGGPPEPETLVNRVYRYEVIAEAVEQGRNVIRIRVDHVGRQTLRPQWLMTFDRDETVLLGVEELVKDVPKGGRSNPSVNDAWMPHFREFLHAVIHDFPRIPATQADESRTITTPGRGAPFTQSIVFSPGQVTATLSRTDPEKSVEHRTTIVWKAGEKWWSSAVTTLAGEVKISAVLEFAPPKDKVDTEAKPETTASEKDD